MARASRKRTVSATASPPPPPPARTGITWGKIAGGVATALTLLFAIPTGWATANCYFNGKNCSYAVIGPDPEGVLRRNGLDIANRLAAGAIDNERASFTFSVQRSLLQDRRVDVSVAFAGQAPVVIDSLRLRGSAELQALPLPQSAELLLAYVSDGWFREPEAHFFLYAVQDQVVLREHVVSCRRGDYAPSSRLTIRNVALAHDPTTVRFDVNATCTVLLVNDSETIYLPRRRYDPTGGSIGDTVSLVLDSELRIANAQSERSTEANEEDRQTDERQAAALSACSANLREEHANDGPYPRFIGVCTSQRYDAYGNLGLYGSAHFQRAVSRGATESDSVSCWGNYLDTLVDQDGQFALAWCRKVTVGQVTRETKLTLNIRTIDGRTSEIEITCNCLSLDIAAPRYVKEQGQLSFELRGNTGVVRVDGRDYQLRQRQFSGPDISPGYNHGRYLVSLTQDLTVATFGPSR